LDAGGEQVSAAGQDHLHVMHLKSVAEENNRIGTRQENILVMSTMILIVPFFSSAV
jgi:hypothetical protein